MEKVNFYPNTIPVVFASDNNYVPFMSATIQSILENAKHDRRYSIFVLHNKISDGSMNLLIKQIAPYENFSIDFINVTDSFPKHNLFVSRHITVEAYFRFLIPELFCEYQKVIYLDCDMIVCTDVAELFEINLENHVMAAMRDIYILYSYYESEFEKIKARRNSLSKLKDPSNYFCDGLLIYNVPLFNKAITQDELFELAAAYEWDFHDQDVLNILTEGKVFFLPFHWGRYNWGRNYIDNTTYLPENLKKEYIDALINPKIIHLVNKPWKYDYYISDFEYFWKYATRTPFIKDIVNSMYISDMSFDNRIINNITHRKGIGLKFILFNCVKAWIFRNKK